MRKRSRRSKAPPPSPEPPSTSPQPPSTPTTTATEADITNENRVWALLKQIAKSHGTAAPIKSKGDLRWTEFEAGAAAMAQKKLPVNIECLKNAEKWQTFEHRWNLQERQRTAGTPNQNTSNTNINHSPAISSPLPQTIHQENCTNYTYILAFPSQLTALLAAQQQQQSHPSTSNVNNNNIPEQQQKKKKSTTRSKRSTRK